MIVFKLKHNFDLPGIESGDTNNESQDNTTKRKLGI